MTNGLSIQWKVVSLEGGKSSDNVLQFGISQYPPEALMSRNYNYLATGYFGDYTRL